MLTKTTCNRMWWMAASAGSSPRSPHEPALFVAGDCQPSLRHDPEVGPGTQLSAVRAAPCCGADNNRSLVRQQEAVASFTLALTKPHRCRVCSHRLVPALIYAAAVSLLSDVCRYWMIVPVGSQKRRRNNVLRAWSWRSHLDHHTAGPERGDANDSFREFQRRADCAFPHSSVCCPSRVRGDGGRPTNSSLTLGQTRAVGELQFRLWALAVRTAPRAGLHLGRAGSAPVHPRQVARAAEVVARADQVPAVMAQGEFAQPERGAGPSEECQAAADNRPGWMRGWHKMAPTQGIGVGRWHDADLDRNLHKTAEQRGLHIKLHGRGLSQSRRAEKYQALDFGTWVHVDSCPRHTRLGDRWKPTKDPHVRIDAQGTTENADHRSGQDQGLDRCRGFEQLTRICCISHSTQPDCSRIRYQQHQRER